MHSRRSFLLLCACSIAWSAGCAQPWKRFLPGTDQSMIIAHLGPPREVYTLPGGSKRLMWPTQPMGNVTTAADVNAAGKIIAVRQVLQPLEFYRAEINIWTQNDVLVHFGRPVETSYFARMKRTVWTYRYLEDNVWHMLYHFYFDDQGVLRVTQKTPDPLYEPGHRGFFF